MSFTVGRSKMSAPKYKTFNGKRYRRGKAYGDRKKALKDAKRWREYWGYNARVVKIDRSKEYGPTWGSSMLCITRWDNNG